MPNSIANNLTAIQQKIELLANSRDDALRQCALLQEENFALKRDLQSCREELHKTRLDAKYLEVSHKLADSPDALVRARHILGTLIKKVDSAINLIKNDPAL